MITLSMYIVKIFMILHYFDTNEIMQELANTWQNYIKGTINIIKQDFCSDIKGANIYIFSDFIIYLTKYHSSLCL